MKKKEYRAILRRKRGAFNRSINERINGSGNLDWSALKELSATHQDENTFDIYDLLSFYNFFNSLYNKKCSSANHPKEGDDNSVLGYSGSIHHDALIDLNRHFTMEELAAAISKLQNNKSSSVDLISNEMLKGAKLMLREVILKLFNACLCFMSETVCRNGAWQTPTETACLNK